MTWIEKTDEVLRNAPCDYWRKKPQVFSSLTTFRGLCILCESNRYNVFFREGLFLVWFESG
jgi:hypothetical protein